MEERKDRMIPNIFADQILTSQYKEVTKRMFSPFHSPAHINWCISKAMMLTLCVWLSQHLYLSENIQFLWLRY